MKANVEHFHSGPWPTADLPDGTYLLHYFGSPCSSLDEIGQVTGGLSSLAWENYKPWTVQPAGKYDWGVEPYWQIAVVPGTPEHDAITTFLAAVQLGVADQTLLGSLVSDPVVYDRESQDDRG